MTFTEAVLWWWVKSKPMQVCTPSCQKVHSSGGNAWKSGLTPPSFTQNNSALDLVGLPITTAFAKCLVLNLGFSSQQITTHVTFHGIQLPLRCGDHPQDSSLLIYISSLLASKDVSFFLFKVNATTHAWFHLFLSSAASLCYLFSFLHIKLLFGVFGNGLTLAISYGSS